MKVLITGATGLIGSALVSHLAAHGDEVIRLVRTPPRANSGGIQFDPLSGIINAQAMEGADAVIHLAGENVAQRWTPEAKKRIWDSRVKVTQQLCETLAQQGQRPTVLLSASAIGYYGNRGEEPLTVDSPSGTGFLAEVCQAWEAATQPAVEATIRVVNLRFGVVLSAQGGALSKMLLPFRLGVGGKVGSGAQYMSWITIDDTVGAIYHALTNPMLRGPMNIVSPHPVKNRNFTHTLGKVLKRPTFLTVPAFALRLALGEMADEAVLSSARVLPARLEATSYKFSHPELEEALRYLLHK